MNRHIDLFEIGDFYVDEIVSGGDYKVLYGIWELDGVKMKATLDIKGEIDGEWEDWYIEPESEDAYEVEEWMIDEVKDAIENDFEAYDDHKPLLVEFLVDAYGTTAECIARNILRKCFSKSEIEKINEYLKDSYALFFNPVTSEFKRERIKYEEV